MKPIQDILRNVLNKVMVKTKPVINIGGIPIHVVSQEEAEKSDFVVCSLMSEPHHGAAVPDHCFRCNAEIWFTPTSSPLKPKRVCFDCIVKLGKEQAGVQNLSE